jgi:hypothetical protein
MAECVEKLHGIIVPFFLLIVVQVLVAAPLFIHCMQHLIDVVGVAVCCPFEDVWKK